MFQRVILRGAAASVAWGYHTAAVLRSWVVTKSTPPGAPHAAAVWSLSANIDRADRFQLQQQPLYLRASPRQGGLLTWPVRSVTVGRERLTATLGPPEG